MLHTQLSGGFDITPSDTVDLPTPTRALYVGVTGDVKCTMADGSVVTWKGLAGGVVHQLLVRRVWATGTAATGIIGGK